MSAPVKFPPTPSIEPQQAIMTDPSGASQGVYVVLVNDDDGLARMFTGQYAYMQQNVTDPARPDGHMTLEYHYSHNFTWKPPKDKIAFLQEFDLPKPAKFSWWRSMFNGTSNGMKRRTQSVAAGLANTGDLITFQNSPKDL